MIAPFSLMIFHAFAMPRRDIFRAIFICLHAVAIIFFSPLRCRYRCRHLLITRYFISLYGCLLSPLHAVFRQAYFSLFRC